MSDFNPQPKFEYWRSSRHLNAVRELPCACCDCPPRSQAAHSNQGLHGKGRGIKSSDQYVIPLCLSCHFSYDAGMLASGEKSEWFNLRLIETANKLKSEGKLLPEAERLLKERGVLE